MAVETSEVVDMIRKGDKLGVMVYLRYGGDPNARNHMGWTLLHLACVEGQAHIVEVLLDAGASVNSCTTDMCTPLHRACTQGYKPVVELLLKKNAYINAQDKAGNTPLHEAARGFHTAIVKLLIEKKADRTKANRKHQLFLQLVGQQLMPAVEAGDADTIMQWLEWGASPDTKGNLHWSILHHASARGQLNIVSLLIQRGGNVNVEDSNKTTPLHTASFHGHLRIASLLLDSNANINATDLRGNTPLHSAIEGSHPDVINLLLERGCDTTIANKEGQIFTHLVNEFLVTSVHASNMSQVTSLLKGRADPNTRDACGCPVLCHAAFKGDMMIAEALLEAGADPDLSDQASKTALHHAAYWGHLFVLKVLLDNGATVNVSDKNGSTPLHEAAREGVEDVITVLMGRGAKFNATDEEGNTPLHAAGKWGQVNAVQLLIEKGASDAIKNKNGLLYSDLALIRAVRTEDQTQVMSGLAWGGDPNSRDARGWTLLHHAVYKGAYDICLLLLECGANVNALDLHGKTPLLLAAYRGNHQIMQVLLDEGADINAQDWNGETPLHWAANEGSVDTVHLLLEHGANTSVKNKAGLLYSDLLLKHLYLAVRHKDADKVVRLVSAGANQFAEVEGIGLNPREEAKRQGLYDILRQMAALAKKEPQPEDDKIIALEDVYRLFEDGYITGDVDSNSSEEEEGSEVEGAEKDSDSDEDAYWKMTNAFEILTVKEAFQEDDDNWLNAWEEKPKVISAKELFEEDQAAFWEFWEEKPKAISAKEFFKEESNWWENDEDENDEKEDKPKIISAKEFFREDECWWRDAVENFDKPKVISAKEFFSDDKPWWETDEEEKPKVISAKEFFKDDNQPWWETGEMLEQGNPDGEVNGLGKKCPSVAHTSRYHSPFGEEESEDDSGEELQEKEGKDNDGATESSDDETEESNRADNFEDATDSALSDSSTMYSASEGERLQASVVFRDTPWWEEVGKESQRDVLKASDAFHEGHWLDDVSEMSEGTETLDMDTSEMSEIATATEMSQGASWLDDMSYMPRVTRSRRSDIHKMRAEVDIDEDSDIEEQGKEIGVEEKIDVEVEREGRENKKVEEKKDEENEISEDDDKEIGDKESSSDSEEIKSEDEMGDISDEELDAMELETEDEEEESLTHVREISPSLSPVLCGRVDWDKKACEGRIHNTTPLVQIDLYEKENSTLKSRTGDRREMSRNHMQAKETPLDANADVVSKADTLEKEDTNIAVETTNIDSLLDPNQLSIYGHYMEGNLQKSDSQTSGYESSLSLSESKTTRHNKNSDSKASVVRMSHEGSDQEKLVETSSDRSKPSETPDKSKPSETPDGCKPSETPDESKPSETPDGSKSSETPNGFKPTETPDESKSSATPDESKSSATPDESKPSETPDGSSPSETSDGFKPSENPEGSKPTETPDGFKPSETLVGSKPSETLDGSTPSETSDGSKPSETPDGSKPSETPDRSKPSETPDGSKPSETLDGSKPSESLDGSKPSETPDRSKPSENLDGSKSSETSDGFKPSETLVEKCFSVSENKGETITEIQLTHNSELETKINTQDSNLERTEINVEKNPEQVNKGQGITDGMKKLKTETQLGTIKHEDDQVTDSQISEGSKGNVAEHSSKPKIMYERSGQTEPMENVTLPKTVNKMDVCLAKVDASLAWVDARLTKDSARMPDQRNSANNLGEKLRAEDVRTYAGAVKDGGSVTPKYCETGRSRKSRDIKEGSSTVVKTKGDEKETVLLMKVHVHVAEGSSGIMEAEENLLTKPEDNTQDIHGAVADNKFTGGTFLVVNNGNCNLKKLPKYVSQLSEHTDSENSINTTTSQENDHIPSAKRSMKTEVMTEQYPITESIPGDKEETDRDVKAEPTQNINITKKTVTEEDSQNSNEKVYNKNGAIGKSTTKMASDEQSSKGGTTRHKESPNKSEKYTYKGNLPPSDQRTTPQESEVCIEDKETISHEKGEESAAEAIFENKEKKEQPRKNSTERSPLDDKSEVLPPSPQKTIWRCSTYEAMSLSDYDNLAFLIRQSSSSPACWSDSKRREWSVSIESLDKASDGTASSTTSTSDQKHYPNSYPVKETLLDEGSTSISSVEQDEYRSNVDKISSSRSHCHVDQNNTEACERSEGQLNIASHRDTLAEEVDLVAEASPVSLPAQVQAQACTNCSENSSDPDPLPVPPRTKERKLPTQTVIHKVPGYSAESQSTNALQKPTNTALLYDPDKKDVGKVVAASQVWPDVPQAHQASAQTSNEVKLDKIKTKELAVMAGKTDPVRRSSSCRLS